MFYRVVAVMNLPEEGQARGLYQHLLGLMPQALTINPLAENWEKSHISWHECHHDDASGLPCILTAFDDTP